jgi:hypothetical protein
MERRPASDLSDPLTTSCTPERTRNTPHGNHPERAGPALQKVIAQLVHTSACFRRARKHKLPSFTSSRAESTSAGDCVTVDARLSISASAMTRVRAPVCDLGAVATTFYIDAFKAQVVILSDLQLAQCVADMHRSNAPQRCDAIFRHHRTRQNGKLNSSRVGSTVSSIFASGDVCTTVKGILAKTHLLPPLVSAGTEAGRDTACHPSWLGACTPENTCAAGGTHIFGAPKPARGQGDAVRTLDSTCEKARPSACSRVPVFRPSRRRRTDGACVFLMPSFRGKAASLQVVHRCKRGVEVGTGVKGGAVNRQPSQGTDN